MFGWNFERNVILKLYLLDLVLFSAAAIGNYFLGIPMRGGEIIFSSFWKFLAILFAGCVFAPVFEEMLFRGPVFFAALVSDSVKVRLATALASSLLFAAAHIPNGVSFFAFLSIFAGGLIFSRAAIKTKSLVPAMILHSLHNASVLIVSPPFIYFLKLKNQRPPAFNGRPFYFS